MSISVRDSIKVINNFSNGTATASGNLAATLSSIEVRSNEAGEWVTLSSCFTAQGGEQFLAITMPQGTFGELPACAFNLDSGIFLTFYYLVDQVSLSAISTAANSEADICMNEVYTLKLEEFVDPVLFENSMIQWQDGPHWSYPDFF